MKKTRVPIAPIPAETEAIEPLSVKQPVADGPRGIRDGVIVDQFGNRVE
jgi:hypothetical protein